ncbi:D-alanyl-D-alanine carboxypeptidase/D-alanyl-D-alanine endopeptidase [Thauera sp. Sel9]|uniref:D-alanyl-D-alanine carboxypeptidase/D-alanyl-D-alanine endopeptidase n=1 Tax=Thauera sp. Sel9 TaxID=2974299 RepID=UPI003FA369BE
MKSHRRIRFSSLSPSAPFYRRAAAHLRPLRHSPCCSALLQRFCHYLGLLCSALILFAPPVFAAGGLPLPVKLALERARIGEDAVSVWVQPVDAVRPGLAFNAGKAMNPASVMKLVTAFAALDRLGPAWTWTTRLASNATVARGVLDGDLYVVGSGDPVLDQERIAKLLRRLRGLGIDRIGGDIVLDASVLKLPPHDPDAFDGRGLRPYNSGPHGLLMHYNTLQLALFPGNGNNESVTVVAEPPLAGVVIDNRLQTSASNCDVWYRDLEARIEPGRRLVLSGSLPAACGPRTWSAAPLPPAEYGAALVATLWSEAGGRLDGQVRDGIAPPGVRTLLSHESPPLADIVRDMNKWSSNVIARQLLADLGAFLAGPASDAPDMVAAGARATTAQLAAAGLDVDGLVIENGSGLSRIERIRADTLGKMLLLAWQRPWMPEFISALPVAGLDGTARNRLRNSPAGGQAHIKTGTLNGVRAIGGYLLDRNGRRHVLVMMVNHPEAAASAAAQDALLEWVWAGQP